MKVLALKHLTRSLAKLVRELSHEAQNFFELALLLAQTGSNQVRIIFSLSSQMEDTREFFTKETICSGIPVTLHSGDSHQWLSDPEDIAIYDWRKRNVETKLRANIPMTRFSP
jgi:hypothetical protein